MNKELRINKVFWIFLLGIILAISLTCKKQPSIPNSIEPCDDCIPMEANFSVGNELSFFSCSNYQDVIGDSLIVSDTFLQGWVTFRSEIECYDSLIWKIGYDTNLRYESEFSVLFGSSMQVPQTIPITLIAYKDLPGSCGLIKEWDTLKKYITIVDNQTISNNYFGDFLGHNTDEMASDTFTVSIYADVIPLMANINRGCDLRSGGITSQNFNFTYRKAFFCQDIGSWDYGCGDTRAVVNYSYDFDTIMIDYYFAPNIYEKISETNIEYKTFIGIRK